MNHVFEVCPDLLHVAGKFKGVLLDAYGVFWGGNDVGLLPGSKNVMEALVASRKIVGILSNATQMPANEIKKFDRHGLLQDKHFHFVVTSGEVARSIFLAEDLPFKTPRKTYWLFCGAHPKFATHEAIFKETGYREVPQIEDADFIYISTPHLLGEDQTDPELFRDAIAKVKGKNLPMICPNPDQFAHEGKPPRSVVRQGTIAKMYEAMGGHVFYIGKPHATAYAAALREFRHHNVVNLEEILMVGDTPETDIRGANLVGLASALVLTGNMGDRIARKGFENALKELTPQDTPTYFVHGLHSSSKP